ncbi:unnamed protein product [Tetraodon nigroviridis]|uniref:(spotted green pufferfish) hypothetical protein n=1 Tax=Tetraodon nigroviridis TaxID=99883 RepID=Q4SIM6_TETNG|nr:unnamed protein product [Tetraodon nigroviridis]
MKRRNADCSKLRRPLKRNRITEGIYSRYEKGAGGTLLYNNGASLHMSRRDCLPLLLHIRAGFSFWPQNELREHACVLLK